MRTHHQNRGFKRIEYESQDYGAMGKPLFTSCDIALENRMWVLYGRVWEIASDPGVVDSIIMEPNRQDNILIRYYGRVMPV